MKLFLLILPILAPQQDEQERLHNTVETLKKDLAKKKAEARRLRKENRKLRWELEGKKTHIEAQNWRRAAEFERTVVKTLLKQLPDKMKSMFQRTATQLRLEQMRITIDMQEVSLLGMLEDVSKFTGLKFDCENIETSEDEIFTIKVSDITLSGMLKLCLNPRDMDFVVKNGNTVLITSKVAAAERKGDIGLAPLLDYLFSEAPAELEKRTKVIEELLEDLDRPDMDSRDLAIDGIRKMGRSARVILSKLKWKPSSKEAGARLKDLIRELDQAEKMLEETGWLRDITFLSLLEDPRAWTRLEKVLGGLSPFKASGFPKKDSGFEEYLQGWWAYSKSKVNWDAEKDKYVPR